MIWLALSGWLVAAALLSFVLWCAARIGSEFDEDER